MNKKNIKMVHDIFAQDGEICFNLEWRKNSTWGHTCALMFRGDKIDLASGCGYAKDTAMLESMLCAITGQYISLGGNSLKYVHGGPEKQALVADLDMVCMFEGRTESGYTIRRKVPAREV